MLRQSIRRNSGFTLTEILIVLGIVVVLSALLFSAFNSVKNKAQMSTCASNLHQIYLALAQYSSDNNGGLPAYPSQVKYAARSGTAATTCTEQSRELVDSLSPYARAKAIWRCPSDGRSTVPTTVECGSSSLTVTRSTSYDYDGWEYGGAGILPVGLDYSRAAVDAPRRPLMQDYAQCSTGDGQYETYNHGGRWNRVFCDGHLKNFAFNCSDPRRPTEQP